MKVRTNQHNSSRFFRTALPGFLSIIFLLLLTTNSSHAQNWHPLKPGYSHIFYPSQGNLYRIQLESATEINGDSVFYVNKVARSDSFPSPNWSWGYWKDNYLASGWVEKPGGKFTFFSSSGDSIFFQLQAPLNQKWLFHAAQNDSAWIIGRSKTPVFGNRDSIVSIQTLSGDTFRFSKNHGILNFPDLRNWTEGGSLGEMDLAVEPQKIKKPGEWFTWQPGDFFGYKFVGEIQYPFTYYRSYEYLTVLSRTDYPGRDSVTFTLQKEGLHFRNGQLNSHRFDTITQTKDLVYTTLPTNLLKGGWAPMDLTNYSPGNYSNQTVLYLKIGPQAVRLYSANSWSAEFRAPVDFWREEYNRNGDYYTEECICYKIGSDSMGNCPPMAVLMAREDEPEISFAVYPNPAQDLIHLDFGKQNLPLPLRWQIFDLQGRELGNGVLEQQSAAISVEELPEGLLLFQIEGVAKPVKVLHRR